MSTAAVRIADSIIRQLRGWQADRNEPPSLRDGYEYPGDLAVDLARQVLEDARREENK